MVKSPTLILLWTLWKFTTKILTSIFFTLIKKVIRNETDYFFELVSLSSNEL